MKKRILLFLSLSVSLALGSLAVPLASVTALSGSSFNAGHIIDDTVFYNGNSITSSQVQSFLNAKVTTCDTNGTQNKSYYYNSATGRVSGSNFSGATYVTTSRAIYGSRYDKYYGVTYAAAPYVCLKDYKQSTPSKAAESGICGYLPAQSNRAASAIITDVSSACGVNPEVLIVLLQKEQGLVTDDWPWDNQFDKATGFACPDTSGCNTAYYGFFNQIYSAARQFKRYQADPTNWNYVAGRSNKIYYNPNTACGYSWVSIQNQATAGLYDYTPYQPNKAALNNLYGSGDSCSAYGNRNFWRYFNDWFGSTYAPDYAANYVSQSPYPTIAPGSNTTAYITFKNMGNTPWYDTVAISNGAAPFGAHPTNLATTDPINHASDFADGSWGTYHNRPATTFNTVYDTSGTAYGTNPHIVKPGESVRYTFTLSVPANYAAGSYREQFVPVVEGGAGIIPTSPTSPWIDITVPAVYSASFVSQSSYPSLVGGEQSNAFLTFKNTSNTSWYDTVAISNGAAPSGSKPTVLATTNPINRASDFAGNEWGSNDNRPSQTFAIVYDSSGNAYSTNPHVVKPGESVRFNFKFTVPDNYTPGTYREQFTPVVEGGAGIVPVSPTYPWIDVTIQDAPSAKPASTNISTTITPIATKTFTYSFKNTGSTTWSSSNMYLNVVSGSAAGLRDSQWTSDTKLVALNESSVAPGSVGTFTVTYDAPIDSASFTFSVAPKILDQDISFGSIMNVINVPKATYKAAFYNQSLYPTMKQNSESSAFFSFKNVGNTPWYDSASVSSAPNGVHPVHLATTRTINRWSKFVSSDWYSAPRPNKQFSVVYESNGTTLSSNQHIVSPGQIVRFNFTLYAPQLTPGKYREYFQPIVEGGNPWDMGQIVWLDVTVQANSFVAKYYSQSPYPTITRGGSKDVFFSFKNNGTASWYDDTSVVGTSLKPVHLATTKPINRVSKLGSLFANGTNRPALTLAAVYESNGTTLSSNQHIVSPGQIGKYTFTLKAPADLATGNYREYFQPILEGGSPWDMSQVVWLDVAVTN